MSFTKKSLKIQEKSKRIVEFIMTKNGKKIFHMRADLWSQNFGLQPKYSVCEYSICEILLYLKCSLTNGPMISMSFAGKIAFNVNIIALAICDWSILVPSGSLEKISRTMVYLGINLKPPLVML